MALTLAQKQALKADIIAATDQECVDLEADPTHPDKANAVALLYNQVVSPNYYVWDKAVDVLVILNNLIFTNYTPNDSPDNTNTYNNRAFTVQIKQQNLALLFMGRTTFDATKLNLRAGLNDATTNLMTGSAGANRSGGWSAILPVLSRKALRIEKLFAIDDGAGIGNTVTDPRGATTNPDLAVYEGTISYNDVLQAMQS